MRLMLILTALLAAGCGEQGGRTGSGVFNDPAKASAESLAEARRIDEVQRLYSDGLYDQAGVALDRLLADGSRHPQAFYLKAQLVRQGGDLDGAIPWASKASEASPVWIEPRILLAQIYLKLERWSAASSVFADIERLAPRGPWGPYGQGAVAAMRGDHATAIGFLDKALDRDPDHLPSIETRANLARLAGDRATEERLLTRAASLEPLDAGTRLRLGELAQTAGRLEDAMRHCLRAYELEPRPTTAQQLAGLARLLGDEAAERQWSARAGAVVIPDPGEEPRTVQ